MITHIGISKKVVRKSARDNPERILRVVSSSLFLKEIWKNGMKGHEEMFASAKGTYQK